MSDKIGYGKEFDNEKDYGKRIEEIQEEFVKLVEPSVKVAKFTEKLFMLIGEMQGEISYYKMMMESQNEE